MNPEQEENTGSSSLSSSLSSTCFLGPFEREDGQAVKEANERRGASSVGTSAEGNRAHASRHTEEAGHRCVDGHPWLAGRQLIHFWSWE